MGISLEQNKMFKEIRERWKVECESLVVKLKKLSKPSLYRKIEDVLYNVAWGLHSDLYDGFEMLEALKDEESLPKFPNKGNKYYDHILDAFPEDHPLKSNKTFQELLASIYHLSNKGKGKGEFLLALCFQGSKEPGSEVDNAFKNIEHVETKAEKATLKGTEDSSKRVLDKYLEKYYEDEWKEDRFTGHYETNNLANVESFLAEVLDLSDAANKRILDKWEETAEKPNAKRVKERKQAVGYEVAMRYQEIDGFEAMAFLKERIKKKKPTGEIPLYVINELTIENREDICEHLSFAPQNKRGGCTQAVGDGYTDAGLK